MDSDSGENAKRICGDGFRSSYSENKFRVVNGLVQPLLTDLYQITMAYAYWKNWKHYDRAVFDMFFRRNPFHGEFTIFAGLEECLRFISDFRFTDSDVSYLKELLPDTTEPEFFGYIRSLTAKDVTVSAIAEGSLVFPRVPLLRVEGPLPVVQLMETTLLNLVNYASLVATNAARHRLAAGSDKELIEFGLRRSQGPDGGVSASRYSFIGGFDATSNVLAGKLFGIPVRGTHAHAFVSSFSSLSEVKTRTIQPLPATGQSSHAVKFLPLVEGYIDVIASLLNTPKTEMNEGELAAFVAYAITFPHSFLALVDTYDVICSGMPNFCVVACALNQLGYRAVGVRIDSGDLAYLSKRVYHACNAVAEKFNMPWFNDLKIVASNQINEETLLSLNSQGHQITSFGIGTNLVTCQTQPALGCVFKLVELDDLPRIKLSQDTNKITMPGYKEAYRLYSRDGSPLVDLLQRKGDDPPLAGGKVLCRHPFEATKRAYVQPAHVESLYKVYWKDNKICQDLPSTKEIRSHTKRSLELLRDDHKRALNPTPYKVSVSESLYTYVHDMWLKHAPIGQLS